MKIQLFKTEILYGKSDVSIHFIHYNFITTFIGKMFIASTEKGVCYLVFENEIHKNITYLKNKFPKAQLIKGFNEFSITIKRYLTTKDNNFLVPINLYLAGTPFQLAVWESLTQISTGSTVTYTTIASLINNKKAIRSVGTAIGKNPIAYIIPCHRVLNKNGKLGGYKWGIEKKKEILKLEYIIK